MILKDFQPGEAYICEEEFQNGSDSLVVVQGLIAFDEGSKWARYRRRLLAELGAYLAKFAFPFGLRKLAVVEPEHRWPLHSKEKRRRYYRVAIVLVTSPRFEELACEREKLLGLILESPSYSA